MVQRVYLAAGSKHPWPVPQQLQTHWTVCQSEILEPAELGAAGQAKQVVVH